MTRRFSDIRLQKCGDLEIFDFKNVVTWKTGLGVRQGHRKYHHSMEHI